MFYCRGGEGEGKGEKRREGEKGEKEKEEEVVNSISVDEYFNQIS